MKTSKPKRVMGIDPGTREMGIAVLEDGKLIHHAVESFSSNRSPHNRLQECRRRIIRLLNDFKPNVIVIERTFFANNRNAALLNVLFDEIRAIARRKKIKLISVAPSTMKKAMCGDGHASKNEIARAVATRFSELKVYIGQDRQWKARQHSNRFDAIALALMAASQ